MKIFIQFYLKFSQFIKNFFSKNLYSKHSTLELERKQKCSHCKMTVKFAIQNVDTNGIDLSAEVHNDSNVQYTIRIVLLEAVTFKGAAVKNVAISDVFEPHMIFPNMPSIRKFQLPTPQTITFSAGNIEVKHQIQVKIASDHEEIEGFINYQAAIKGYDDISLTSFLRKFLEVFHSNTDTPIIATQFEGSFEKKFEQKVLYLKYLLTKIFRRRTLSTFSRSFTTKPIKCEDIHRPIEKMEHETVSEIWIGGNGH